MATSSAQLNPPECDLSLFVACYNEVDNIAGTLDIVRAAPDRYENASFRRTGFSNGHVGLIRISRALRVVDRSGWQGPNRR